MSSMEKWNDGTDRAGTGSCVCDGRRNLLCISKREAAVTGLLYRVCHFVLPTCVRSAFVKVGTLWYLARLDRFVNQDTFSSSCIPLGRFQDVVRSDISNVVDNHALWRTRHAA